MGFSGANINGCDKYQVDMVLPLMNCVKYNFLYTGTRWSNNVYIFLVTILYLSWKL